MKDFYTLTSKSDYQKIEPDFNLLENHFPDIFKSFEEAYNLERFQIPRKENYYAIKAIMQKNGVFINEDQHKKIVKVLEGRVQEIPANIYFLPIYIYNKYLKFSNSFGIKTVVKERKKKLNILPDIMQKLLDKGEISVDLSFHENKSGKKIELDHSILIDPKFKIYLADAIMKYYQTHILIKSRISDDGIKKEKTAFTSFKKELSIQIHSYLEKYTPIQAVKGKTHTTQLDLIVLYFKVCGLIGPDEDDIDARENILRYITR